MLIGVCAVIGWILGITAVVVIGFYVYFFVGMDRMDD